MEHQRRLDNGHGMLLLWLNWVIATGSLTFLVIISLVVPPTMMPIIAFSLGLAVSFLVQRNRHARIPVCYLIPFITVRILFFSGVIMLIINFLYSKELINLLFDPETLNADIPFITMLIINPVAVVITAWVNWRGNKYSFCRDCRRRYGTPAERGFLGILFKQESEYQIRLLFLLTLLISIGAYIYYLVLYINVNLNVPDKFFFFVVPTLMFFIAAVFTGLRYIGIWKYYDQNIEGSAKRHGASSLIRFLIISDNSICLRVPETDPDFISDMSNNKFDTPASLYIPYRKDVSLTDAEFYFNGMSHLSGVKMRFMYSNVSANADCNIFHFLCFLTNEEQEKIKEEFKSYQFFTLQQVQHLINMGLTQPLLSAEIIRLHTVAMAWKTYDREGHKLYKIKHYHPTFKLQDVHKWDVDYNDPEWLFVAECNEDMPFFKLNKFWRKYFNKNRF